MRLLFCEEQHVKVNISRIKDSKREIALEKKKNNTHSYIGNAFHNNVSLDCFYISEIIA